MKRCNVLLNFIFLTVTLFLLSCTPKDNTKTQATAAEQSQGSSGQSSMELVVGSGNIKLNYHLANIPSDKSVHYFYAQGFVKLHPEVTITFTGSPDPDTHDQMMRLMASTNSLPELHASSFNHIPDFLQTGAISDLTAAVEGDKEWLNSFNASALDKMYYNGKLWGIPYQTDIQGWWFNKALFDKYNLAIPVTYDDFKKAITVFKQNGVLPIAHGGKDIWSQWGYNTWFYRHGLDDVLEGLQKGTIKFSDPRTNFLTVFERIKEWADLGAYPPNATTMSYTQALETFKAGNAAIITTGSWELGDFCDPVQTPITNDIIFNWGPEFPNQRWNQKIGGKETSWALIIGKKLESRPDAYKVALDLLKYVCSPEGGRITFEGGYFPPVKANIAGLTIAPLYRQALERSGDNYNGIYQIGMYFDTSFWDPIWNACTGVITGTITPRDAVRILDDWQATQ